MRWVMWSGEASLRGPVEGPYGVRDVVVAMVRPEKSGYRVYLRVDTAKYKKLPNRSVVMEKMMALALAHVRMG